MKKRLLIIGAGLSGATIARQLADNNYKVTLIEKRAHIAGIVSIMKIRKLTLDFTNMSLIFFILLTRKFFNG